MFTHEPQVITIFMAGINDPQPWSPHFWPRWIRSTPSRRRVDAFGIRTPMVGERLAGQPRPEIFHRHRQHRHRIKLFILSETTFRNSPNTPWISSSHQVIENPRNSHVFLMVNDGEKNAASSHGYFEGWASGRTLALATLATLTKPGAKTIGDQSIYPCHAIAIGAVHRNKRTYIYIFIYLILFIYIYTYK